MNEAGRGVSQVPIEQTDEHSIQGEIPLTEPIDALYEAEEAATLALEPLPAAVGRWEAAEEDVEREFDAAVSDVSYRARLHQQLAVLAQTQRGDRHAAYRHKALFHLQRALELAPHDLSCLRALQQALRQQHDWTGLLRLLEREWPQTSSATERARIWREMGWVYEDWLANDAAARALYEKSLAADPADLSTLQRMLGLLQRAGDEQGQIDLLRRMIAVSTDRHRRSLYQAEMGALHTRRTDYSAAIECYQAAYAEDPASESVQNALSELYERKEDWGALVDFLLARAERASRTERTRYLGKAAAIARDRLRQDDRALQILGRVCEEDDSHPELLSQLAELLEATGRFEELADTYGRLIGQFEAEEATDIHIRLGVLLEERLDRPEDALEHFRRAIDITPRHAGALHVLERLYRRLGQWEDLILLKLQAVNDIDGVYDQACLLAQVGQICQRDLGDPARAIKYHERALAVYPHFPLSVEALESLFLKAGRHEDLIGLLDAELKHADLRAALVLLDRMAWVSESLLGDPRRAVDYCRRALALEPANTSLLRRVQRLLAELGEYEQLVELIRSQRDALDDLDSRAVWCEEAARILEHKLGRPTEAVQYYVDVLAAYPDRWTAVDGLMRLYERFNRWDDLFDLVERESVARSIPASLFVSMHLHWAEIAECQLNQLDRSERHLLAALAAHRGHPVAIAALERVYCQTSRWDALRELLQTHVAAVPVALQPALWFRLGQLCEVHLKASGEATEWYRRAVSRTPVPDEYREALIRRLIVEGRAGEAVEFVRELIENCGGNIALRRALRKRMASLWLDALHSPKEAIECLEQVLGDGDENDVETLGKLVQLYRQTDAYKPWVETLERLASATDDLFERAQLLEEAARIVALHLPERDPAPIYQVVLQHRPHDRVVLGTLLQLYSQRGDVANLAHVLEADLPSVTAAEERGTKLLHLAMCREQLGDLAAADHALEQAAALPGQWVAAAELQRVRQLQGGGRRLIMALRRVAELSRDQRNATHALFTAAQIAEEQPNRADEALELLGRVLNIDPLHEAAARQQEHLLIGREDWTGLIQANRARIAAIRSRPDAEDPRHRAFCVTALIQNAHVERDRLNTPEDALLSLERALEFNPHHQDALLALADLHSAMERWGDAVVAYQRAVAIGDDAGYLAHVQFELGRIWQERQGNAMLAISAFQNVLVLDPHDRRALQRLSQLFQVTGDWPSAVDMVQRLLDADQDSVDRRQHLLSLADIFEQGVGDLLAAAVQLESVLELYPADEGVVDRLVQLNGRLGRWSVQRDVIQRYLAALPPDQVDPALRQRLRMAELLERHKQLDEALNQYASVLRLDPTHVAAQLATARLFGEMGRVEAAVDAYRQVLISDPLNQHAISQLRALWSRHGNREMAYAAAAVLVCCEMASESDRRVYRQHRRHVSTEQNMDPEFFNSVIIHDALSPPARALLGALSSVAHRLRPVQLEEWHVNRGDRIGQRSDDPLRELIRQVSKRLNLHYEVEVFLAPGRAHDIELILGDPPALAVGRGALATLSSREVRFGIAELLAHLVAGTTVVYDTNIGMLRQIMSAAWEVAGLPPRSPELEPRPETGELARQMRRSLGRRERRLMEESVHALSKDWQPLDRLAYGIRCTALRAALWVVDDLSVALNYIRLRQTRLDDAGPVADSAQASRERPESLDLIRFWLSESFQSAKR